MAESDYAARVEQEVNLKKQLNTDISDADMIFKDTSPPTRWEILYATDTGERVPVKRHRVLSILQKRLPDGRPAFTADKNAVPQYILGSVKCFLAKDSPVREAVDALNISPGYYCEAEHLANDGAAEIHAEHRHPNRWRQYQRWLERQERDQERAERQEQTTAMLAMAGGAAAAQAAPSAVAVAEKPADLSEMTNKQLRAAVEAKTGKTLSKHYIGKDKLIEKLGEADAST